MVLLVNQAQDDDIAAIVSSAVVNAADYLGFTAKNVADIIGLSEATISRMKKQDYVLVQNSKSYELALIFLRFFRSLDSVFGGDQKVARQWINSFNTTLEAKPIDLIFKVDGLVNVLSYLDSRRAKV